MKEVPQGPGPSPHFPNDRPPAMPLKAAYVELSRGEAIKLMLTEGIRVTWGSKMTYVYFHLGEDLFKLCRPGQENDEIFDVSRLPMIKISEYQLPVQALKKKYWLWDVKSANGPVYKSNAYLDEMGLNTKGNSLAISRNLILIRKHENEFIEV